MENQAIEPQESPPLPISDRRTVLAASAPWLGGLLNLVPGLGTGYIYQRRWRAYWLTTAASSSWFLLGAFLGEGRSGPAGNGGTDSLIGLGGLLLLAGVTATEAFLAGRKARME